ncbi:flagellar basal body P-ring protein FlgI [Armatimonas sp.]|uniref:flagellar basal body P-ring protein FlgI n=1 Tax=Armatimonas sp. TaxID=1872638 RepID=UPI00286C59E9|nr:flagellar basal body P-ring protein FlgI [Armatimonas sp.]
MFRQNYKNIATASVVSLSALILVSTGRAADLEPTTNQAPGKQPPAKLEVTEIAGNKDAKKTPQAKETKPSPAELKPVPVVIKPSAKPVLRPITTDSAARPNASVFSPGGFPIPTVRIRDIARVESVRSNQLVGYGLVVGLNGTGDTQQSPFTIQAVVAMLQRFGVTVDPRVLRTRNVAAVMITAEISAFAKNGSKLDVTVSSVGDAMSLQGGVLLQTPLIGADENVYAVAQGGLMIGGFAAGGGGNSATKNHPTAGRVPEGAIVEREIPTKLTASDGSVRINLSTPDFENTTKIALTINEKLGAGTASALDSTTIRVQPPAGYDDPVRLIAEVGALMVQPSVPAKVVLNERTGTVIIGGNVRIAPVAVAHGALTVEITSETLISQPGPLSRVGETVVTGQTDVAAGENRASLVELKPGATLAELVRALNALRVSPRDVIAIILAIKNAGALFAEVEVQ